MLLKRARQAGKKRGRYALTRCRQTGCRKYWSKSSTKTCRLLFFDFCFFNLLLGLLFCLWLLGFWWNLYARPRKCVLLQFISHLEKTASTSHRDQWELCVLSCCLCEHAGVALFISLVVISEHILWLMAAFGLQAPLMFAVFVLNQTEFLPHFTVETRCYKL